MRGLLLVGGEGPQRETLTPFLADVEHVVAADSGFDLCLELDIDADFVVGDMDSVQNRLALNRVPRDRVCEYSHDKDETDTEIGLQLLRQMGCTQVILAGGGGGRLDHLLAICALFERDLAPDIWLTRREHVQVIRGAADFCGWRGQTISFFPIGPAVQGVRSEGLKWSLNEVEFRRGYPGISNVVTADRLKVAVGRGALLMVRNLPGAQHVKDE